MAIVSSVSTYNYVCDTFADLPATPPPGQLAFVLATGNAYYSQNGSWRLIPGVNTSGISFDNAPAVPHAYSDEFDAATLNARWTLSSSGTTNAATTGTVVPTSSLTTPIYDLSTWPGWILFQSDNSSAGAVQLQQTLTVDTNATFFYKVSLDNRNYNATNEGQILFQLRNSGDANEVVACYIQNFSGGGFRWRISVNNNGVITEVTGGIQPELTQMGPFYIALWKLDNVYTGGYAQGDGTFTTLGSVTKTGVTTFDQIQLIFYTANETPSFINGCDFFRYYNSVTYALKN